jgi:NAD-dependent deacetylase
MSDESGFESYAPVASALSRAHRVAVLTGAGMSADSGLPTYRGIGGLYNDMTVEAGMAIEDILHAYTLARDPALTWKYIAQIERACRAAGPNEGHRVLARWQDRYDLWVVTQNVDGFHCAAGSRNVIELHGNLTRLYCCACHKQFPSSAFDFSVLPPRCDECDGLVRPNAVLFGELLPDEALAAYERELAHGFDVILAIGTSALFPYISEPLRSAATGGTVTVEINPERTVVSDLVTHRVAERALCALQRLDALLA